MKKIISLLLCVMLLLGILPGALAEVAEKTPIVDTSDAEALAILDGYVALIVDQNTIFYNGEKHETDAAAYVTDGRTLVPVRAVSEAFGLSVGWDEATQTVTINQNTRLVIGSNALTLADGSVYTLDVPAATKNGRTYIPLRALCEQALGKTVHWNERGIIVIGDKTIEDFDAKAAEVYNYLTYDRPDTDQVLALFAAENGDTHPRVLADKERFDRVLANAKNNAQAKAYAQDVLKTANQYLNTKMPTYEIPDGLRLLEVSRNIYDRTKHLAMAYLLTRDMKYADNLYAVYTAAGNFPDWNPRHFLDTGEMICAFSIGYDWLYDVWTDEQKEFLANCIYEKGLVPGYECYFGNWPKNNAAKWIHNGSNWSLVCSGGMVMGAVAVFEKHPEMCAEIISYAVRDVEYPLTKMFPDGAWYEGVSYWHYLMRYAVNMFSTLDACFGTDFGLTDTYAMDKTTDFALASGGPIAINNFHDAGQSHLNADVYFYLAEKYNKPGYTAIHKYQMSQRGVPATPLDLLWYNPETDTDDFEFPLDHYFGDTELVSMRASWTDKTGAWVSYHAGIGKANHSHLDSGNYVLDIGNARWVIDLPAEDYNIGGYFGSDRYNYYRTRPEGHNLYVINPQAGSEGQVLTAFTTVETLVSKPKGAYSIVDLTPAYANWATSARRGFMLANGRRSVLVRDEITLKEDDSEIFWFVHTGAKVNLIDERTATFEHGGQTLYVYVDTNIEDAKLSIMDAKPLETSPVREDQNPNDGFKKLCLNGVASGDVYIQCKYILSTDPAVDEKLPTETLSEWSIPDGELLPLPTLNSLSINGKPLADFSPSKNTYTYNSTISDGGGHHFNIEATANEEVEITYYVPPHWVYGDTYQIKVYYKDSPDIYNVYTIERRMKEMHIGYKEEEQNTYLAPDTITGTGGDTNPPFQIADNNLSKPWTANGTHSVTYHYNEPVTLGGMALSCGSGDKRIYTFDVDISEDGIHWTNVAKGLQNSGTTTDFEYYDFSGSYTANQIRFTGYGYNTGTWNNFNELCFYTDAAQYERDKAVREARFARKGADMLLKVGETKPLDLKFTGEETIDKIELYPSSNISVDAENMTVTALSGGNATLTVFMRTPRIAMDTPAYLKVFTILIEE